MAAKARFDSGEIPESSPLFKRLDAYGVDLKIPFIPFLSGRISCARTIVRLDTDALPLPGLAKLFGSMTKSEFTGATTYDAGIKVGITAQNGAVNVGANLGISGSVSTDGQGIVKDYSVTASTGVSVSSKGTTISVNGEATFGPNGMKDSDFSAGISHDLKNATGGEATAAFEASTKRGCKLSAKVSQESSFKPKAEKSEDEGEKIDVSDKTPNKIFKKDIWSGKFEQKK
jgi:hypothetical protein